MRFSRSTKKDSSGIFDGSNLFDLPENKIEIQFSYLMVDDEYLFVGKAGLWCLEAQQSIEMNIIPIG